MNITIRKATTEDLLVVQQLNATLFQEELVRDPLLNLEWSLSSAGATYFRKRIEAKGNSKLCLVAEEKGQIVGYVAASLRRAGLDLQMLALLAELENMFILAEYRGQGIGTALCQDVRAWAKEAGAVRFEVTGYTANVSAMAFYRKQGFADLSQTLSQEL